MRRADAFAKFGRLLTRVKGPREHFNGIVDEPVTHGIGVSHAAIDDERDERLFPRDLLFELEQRQAVDGALDPAGARKERGEVLFGHIRNEVDEVAVLEERHAEVSRHVHSENACPGLFSYVSEVVSKPRNGLVTHCELSRGQCTSRLWRQQSAQQKGAPRQNRGAPQASNLAGIGDYVSWR